MEGIHSPEAAENFRRIMVGEKKDIVSSKSSSYSAPFFGFIADEATNVSRMEQMALCLCCSGYVTENLIGFAECISATGESLSEAFLFQLRNAGVNMDKLRVQCYDGASNMSMKFRRVQARIREIHPKSFSTHYRAHCLNLAICHAPEEPIARNMIRTV